DEKLGDKIQQIPGIAEVIPGLMDFTSFEESGLVGVLVQGWVPESMIFNHLTTVEGRALRRGEKKTAVIGTVLAKNLDKKVGDKLSLFDDHFEIVGIYRSSNIFEEGAVTISLEELQRLMERQGLVTGFTVIMKNSSDKAALDNARKQI